MDETRELIRDRLEHANSVAEFWSGDESETARNQVAHARTRAQELEWVLSLLEE